MSDIEKPYDGSTPLELTENERFLLLVLAGNSQATAYRMTRKRKITKESAKVGASKLINSEPVKSRRIWLMAHPADWMFPTQANTPQLNATRPAPKPPRDAPSQDTPEETWTPAQWTTEILDACRRAIGARVPDSATIAAAKQVVSLLRLDERPDETRPDPCAIVEYVTQAAGRTHAEIVDELGGLRWMIMRLQELTRSTWPAMRRALADAERRAEPTTTPLSETAAPTADE